MMNCSVVGLSGESLDLDVPKECFGRREKVSNGATGPTHPIHGLWAWLTCHFMVLNDVNFGGFRTLKYLDQYLLFDI
jgi:hypothetical protein